VAFDFDLNGAWLGNVCLRGDHDVWFGGLGTLARLLVSLVNLATALERRRDAQHLGPNLLAVDIAERISGGMGARRLAIW